MSKRKEVNTRFLSPVLFIVGSALALAGGCAWVGNHAWPKPRATAPPEGQAVVETVNNPDETPVAETTLKNYTVPAQQPRSLEIARLGIQALVQKVGRTSNNEVAVPSNVSFAGWYTGSVAPGEKGLSIIDGHVSGHTTGGVFQRLSELRPSDTITVEFGDRTVKHFSVIKVTSVPLADASRMLFAKMQGVSSQLNLITCSGTYQQSIKTFTHRLIVVANKI